MAKIYPPFEQALPAPSIAPRCGGGTPRTDKPAHEELCSFRPVGADLDQEIDHWGAAGEQDLAWRALLVPVGDALASHLRNDLTKARLEIDERLQILSGQARLGELRGDDMQAVGAEREFVLALGIVPMDLPQRLQGCTDAVDGWRKGLHVVVQLVTSRPISEAALGNMPRQGKELARICCKGCT